MTISVAEHADDSAPELAQYGVTTEHFEFGGYRYTNLSDAIARAKRP